MIIVTGTKRSGTSMWMKLLIEAGFPSIGRAFPRNWGETIRDANPAGFYESDLREGVYHATNPHPRTGHYLFPEVTRRHALKVFVPGLIRTDRAYIDKVVATMRPWREYVRSLDRLYTMERKAMDARRDDHALRVPPPAQMPAAFEWWTHNFSLISDVVTRRYPMFMVGYDAVVESPEKTLGEVFAWLGDGDVRRAIEQVRPQLRTQDPDRCNNAEDAESGLEPEIIEVFDELYETVLCMREIDQGLVDRLNVTNERLSARIDKALREVARQRCERAEMIRAARNKAA
jgi:hypothetical protein